MHTNPFSSVQLFVQGTHPRLGNPLTAQPLTASHSLAQPLTYFCNEISIVLEASGGCCKSITDGLEFPGGCCEAIYILLQKILMVSEASGSRRESIIDGLESPGRCCEAIYTLLQRNTKWFWKLQAAAVNPL